MRSSSRTARMISKAQALTEDEFHEGRTCEALVGDRDSQTEAYAYRRDGPTKTWKTWPHRFRVPLKLGERRNIEITESNAYLFHLPEDCPNNLDTKAATAMQ